jgi:hypothetical protein
MNTSDISRISIEVPLPKFCSETNLEKYEFLKEKYHFYNLFTFSTRTAWAVFKYCGTKTVPLKNKK